MQRAQPFQTFLNVRKRRTEQAQKNFVEARRELESALEILRSIDDRIEALHEAIHASTKYYAAELLPLNQLSTVQRHLNNLHDQLLQEKHQQREAWSSVSEASHLRDEKITAYMKMQRKEDQLASIEREQKRSYAQRVSSQEEELVTEQWGLSGVPI